MFKRLIKLTKEEFLLMKKINGLILIVVLGSFTTTSFAGDWSVGVRAGQSKFDDIDNVCFLGCNEVDDSDTALGINLGYAINDTWGIELGYIDLGTISINDRRFVSVPGRIVPQISIVDVNVELDGSAFYLAGSGTVALADKWSATAMLGVASIDADATASGSVGGVSRGASAISVSDEEAYGAALLNYHFTDKFKVGLRYEVISDASAITLGANFSF